MRARGESWVCVLLLVVAAISNVDSCIDVDATKSRNSLPELLARGFPLRVKLSEVPKANAFLSMIPDQTMFSIAFGKNRSFRLPVPDDASPIGFRRADTFNINLPWFLLKEIIDFTVRRSRNPSEAPPSHWVNTLTTYQEGPFNGETIDLKNVILNPDYGMYADGAYSGPLQELVQGGPLAGLTQKLTTWLLEHYGSKSTFTSHLWFSGGGTEMTTHIDTHDNWYCQVSGKKKVTLHAPEDSDKLYPMQFNVEGERLYTKMWLRASGDLVEVPVPLPERDPKIHTAVNLDWPDLARFPKFANSTPVHCNLQPGRCMWLPAGWWHAVKAQSGHLNVGLNYWWHAGDLEKSGEQWSTLQSTIEESMKYLRRMSRKEGASERSAEL